MARILIVEDEFLIAMSLEYTLEEAGHVVRVAHNGRKALEMLNAFHPDVVITDYMMPLMDGAELIGRLRSDPATAEISIILATAISRDMLEGRIDGFDIHMNKPVSEDGLLATIEGLLSGRSAGGRE